MATPNVKVEYNGTTPYVTIESHEVTYLCRLSSSGPNTVQTSYAGKGRAQRFMNPLETAFARAILAAHSEQGEPK